MKAECKGVNVVMCQ